LITGVETTFREVTVDSSSFKWKNKLGTRRPIIRQRCRRRPSVKIRGLATTQPLPVLAKLPLRRAAASTESP
jgi:hypothetical protein